VSGQERFETASVKAHPGMITTSIDPMVKGNRMTATASTVVDLIVSAYHLRYDQLSGAPGWASAEHYDVVATADWAISKDQMRTMLQALLAERFHLQVHRETKEVPMYALVVDKHRPKLQESSADETPKGAITGDGKSMHMEAAKWTMAQLATRLSTNGAGRPVLDKTGLTGIYTFTLNWTPGIPVEESELPPLWEALQSQLGLKLEPTKGPGEFIVVDHVEKPSAN
jgi:uncharacterized protein (TIGR03435 family)